MHPRGQAGTGFTRFGGSLARDTRSLLNLCTTHQDGTSGGSGSPGRTAHLRAGRTMAAVKKPTVLRCPIALGMSQVTAPPARCQGQGFTQTHG